MKNSFIGSAILILVLLLSATSTAGTLTAQSIDLDFEFSLPIPVHHQGFDRFVTDQGLYNVNPGEPMVPMKTVRILLPENADVAQINVNTGDVVVFDGRYVMEAVPQFQSLSESDVEIDRAPYSGQGVFPGEFVRKSSIQYFRGAKILVLNLYPFQYDSDRAQAYYYPELSVNVELTQGKDSADHLRFTGTESDRRLIRGMVENPGDLNLYPMLGAGSGAAAEYVVVTTEELAEVFGEYASWLSERNNLTTRVKLLSDIRSEYSGRDDAEKIRNFIIDAYETLGTRYVLLGGDSDPDATVIPHRGFYGNTNGEEDFDIPSDLYFASLDGNWDHNGNGIFGEKKDGPNGQDVDLMADVFVGRIPAQNAAEAGNQLHKIMYHRHQDFNGKLLSVGEKLWDDPLTWGGDYQDSIWDDAEDLTVRKLYDRNGSYSEDAVIGQMNTNDFDLVGHTGHSGVSYVMGLMGDQITGLTNTHYFLTYSIGCYSASFDNRMLGDDYAGYDSAGEKFVVGAKTGAYAYIGNSRLGWAVPGEIGGPSYEFNKSFVEAVFVQQYDQLGPAFNESKNDLIGKALDSASYLWIYYDLNLLGDPFTYVTNAGYDGSEDADRQFAVGSDNGESDDDLDNTEETMTDDEFNHGALDDVEGACGL